MKKKNLPFINIGVSSIITIFLAFFLITFAALSMLTANSDYTLSRKTAEAAANYYTADANARIAAASIEEILYQLYLDSYDSETFFSKLTPELFSEEFGEDILHFRLSVENEAANISYETVISETERLYVSLTIQYPEFESDTLLTITNWQSRSLNE